MFKINFYFYALETNYYNGESMEKATFAYGQIASD